MENQGGSSYANKGNKASAGSQYKAEFAQDNSVGVVSQKVKKSEQNKIQDNYQTPNEKYDEEFAADQGGTSAVTQKVQNSAQSKIQNNAQTPNEKFDENFNTK
jgi:small acid-soluble spore protein E (minor gamma-type SASP)